MSWPTSIFPPVIFPPGGNIVRMNPVVDENKKEESWKMRRPALVVTV